jgi:hypothetical protein
MTTVPLEHELRRGMRLAKEGVNNLKLDLRGLTVLTECASGPYAFTPLMAAMAGATVYALGRDTAYGTYDYNKHQLIELGERAGINGAIFCSDSLGTIPDHIVDIVTNSGMVRPLGRRLLPVLSRNAVVALMWETWEHRSEEVDLPFFVEQQVPVIGTCETGPCVDMKVYPGLLAMKLLFDLRVEPFKSRIALIGGGLTGNLIAQFFHSLGFDFLWYADDRQAHGAGAHSVDKLPELYSLDSLDAVICAEHVGKEILAGSSGYLSFSDLASAHPAVRWGHLSGVIDIEALKVSGIYHYPEEIQPGGYMTYNGWEVGYRPVIELCCAGLKVGEIAVRARMQGAAPQEAIEATVRAGIGQDWPEPLFALQKEEF